MSPDVRAMVRQLREQARQHGDEEVLAAANKLLEHAESGRPDPAKMTFYLKSLQTIASLAPLANSILSAIANVGG